MSGLKNLLVSSTMMLLAIILCDEAIQVAQETQLYLKTVPKYIGSHCEQNYEKVISLVIFHTC